MNEETASDRALRVNCSIIIAFFQLLVSAATIFTVAGIHAVSDAAQEELSRYDAPAPKRIEAPKPEPRPRRAAIPVAMSSPGDRP